MKVIYLFVALFSTTIGATSGLGGGVIIKPVLDALGQYDIITIGIISSFTVLSMAVVSTVKQYVGGIRFEGKKTAFISLGSILGGISGKIAFSLISNSIIRAEMITAIQSIILAFLLILVLIYLLKKNIQSFHIHNKAVIFASGFFLGIIASFLGVGGGPFNVVLLALLFSMDSKSAAVHSVLIILFSQTAKLLTIAFDTGFSQYDLFILYYMIPGGIVGGFIGSSMNKHLKGELIEILFKIIVSLIILLNLYNFFASVL